MVKINPLMYLYNCKSMHEPVCVCVVEYLLVCACVYMQHVQVSLRPIGDYCASISMPLSSGQ